MPFVPIESSDVEYEVDFDNVEFASSVVTTLTNAGGNWIINFPGGATVRVTCQTYVAAGFSLPATLQGDVNTDNGGVTPQDTFTPSPRTFVIESGNDLTFVGSIGGTEGYTFLVEVMEGDPGAVSYNCECDDEYPSRTLAQMRAMVATRLGYAAQVASGNYPPGVATLIDSFLQEAQELAYRAYKDFRLERFFTWDMVAGVRFYDLLENSDVCTKKLDPRMLTWVGISQNDNFWRPLVCGIKPEYYYGQITSWPQYYEIRQCIEVWPPPSDDTWKLRIKGYFDLMRFTADTDKTTIDYRAIFLLALANAKAHLGQPDAANYASQYREFLGNLTAGSHMTRRYIPGDDGWVPPPLPVLTGYPGDP